MRNVVESAGYISLRNGDNDHANSNNGAAATRNSGFVLPPSSFQSAATRATTEQQEQADVDPGALQDHEEGPENDPGNNWARNRENRR